MVKENPLHNRLLDLSRHLGGDKWEHDEADLCSMCLDELWEWVFEDDIDRSDKADPLPLDRMQENVNRHIEDLQGVLEEIEEAKQ